MSERACLGISDLVRHAARAWPDGTAIVAGDVRLSWAELDARASWAAAALRASGAEAGERVSLSLPSGAQFVIGYLAALRAGLVAVPVNPAYSPTEIEHILADSGATIHLDAEQVHALLVGAGDAEGDDGADRGADPGADPGADRGGEALSALLYTGGTGGRPRGAMLSARALLANLDQLAAVQPPLLSAGDVLFVPLPLSHVFGLNAGLGMAARVGATAVLAARFDPAATLATMAAERVSAVLGVPGQYAAWLREADVAAGFASVRFAMSGSSTLPRAVVEAFGELGVVLHDGYGLTEAAPVVSINALGAGREHPTPGSVGHAVPGVQVELRDADGEQVEAGDPGRLFVRGANLFSGYWPRGEDGPDGDGWFATGDLAIADDAGELHLLGRSEELVVVNGFSVYPTEVEAVLAAEPGVAEVAVVGSASATSPTALRAYVVPVAGAVLDAAELRAAAQRYLARFKVPESVEVVPCLPRTVAGKIMKWALDPGGTGDVRG